MYRDKHHTDDTLVAWGTESAQGQFRNRRARAAHKPVIAIFADHLLVPSKTDCSTDIMWPECAFSSTPKTDLNSDETLFHISCVNGRDLVLSAYRETRLCFEIVFTLKSLCVTAHSQRKIIWFAKYCWSIGIQKEKKRKRNFNQRANLIFFFAIRWKLRSLLQLTYYETEYVAGLLPANPMWQLENSLCRINSFRRCCFLINISDISNKEEIEHSDNGNF